MTSEEDVIELDYPEWLYQDLIEGTFPGSQGVVVGFDKFNQMYTLHDSYWIGAFFDIAYEQSVTLAIFLALEKNKCRLEI